MTKIGTQSTRSSVRASSATSTASSVVAELTIHNMCTQHTRMRSIRLKLPISKTTGKNDNKHGNNASK